MPYAPNLILFYSEKIRKYLTMKIEIVQKEIYINSHNYDDDDDDDRKVFLFFYLNLQFNLIISIK